MDRHQGIDELLERRSLRLGYRSPAGRHRGADGRSENALHDVEGCLEDVDVATGQNGSGDADGLVLDGIEDPELTEHIVRGGRAGMAGGSAQHPAARTAVEGEHLARATTPDRIHGDRNMSTQPFIEVALERFSAHRPTSTPTRDVRSARWCTM